MTYKKWIIADANKEVASAISEKFNIDPFLAFLFVSRGLKDELAVTEFLSESCSFSSPYGLKDMDKAVGRINAAINKGEKICIYGDYDCDGVTATALLYSFLESMGANVSYYIPDRESEGYGINIDAIDKIKADGVSLIVTVDNGVSAIDEANYIYDNGMELVITDHHQMPSVLPKAHAVVNPHREDNENVFKDLAGVGVAFKVVCAVYGGDVEDMLEQYGDLVALGTIADVVPLRGENRGLVRAGIEQINNAPRPGVDALKKAVGGDENGYSANDVAFRLCPRINAPGRVDSALRSLELLLCESMENAAFCADMLCTENTHRQELEKEILLDVQLQIKNNPSLVHDSVIVISGEGYHVGVVGIVASHVVDLYGKPAIIIGVGEDGSACGSARSIKGFNIFEAIDSCSDLLLRCGGHPLAAGLAILPENIDLFRKKVNSFAKEKYAVMPAPVLQLDCKLSPFYLSLDLVKDLSVLEPCGAGNPGAVFGLYGMTLVSVTGVGENRHVRLELEKKGKKIKIMKFGVSPQDFAYFIGEVLDLAVRVSNNIYKGKEYLSVHAVDIHLHGVDDDKYFSEKNAYEQYLRDGTLGDDMYPDRDVCSLVYRFIKNAGVWSIGEEAIYFRLQKDITYSQLKFALQAFEQAELINCNKEISLLPVSAKADLENTQILKSLKGRMGLV